MPDYFELELGLEPAASAAYALRARFSRPDSDADELLDAPSALALDFPALADAGLDAAEYGRRLGGMLLGDSAAGNMFRAARAKAQGANCGLRVRLAMGRQVRALHGVHWEKLREPGEDAPLATRAGLVLSRYLPSSVWVPLAYRSRAELRALVVIADPENIGQIKRDDQPLAPVDVAGELERAKAALGDIPCETLAVRGTATLANIAAKLREGFDILYLVCHGTLRENDPRLWLEDEAGKAARVPGEEFVARLTEGEQRPRLVVLASCQSAATGSASAEVAAADQGALAALGPRLAMEGVAGVLAMQGNVTMQTVAKFMPVFFKELAADGQVDRAMAVARTAVSDRPDWWMPVLFLRLRSGRLWHGRGFAREAGGFDRWEGVVTAIDERDCIPILGPGLAESMLGSLRDLAIRMADRLDVPLTGPNRKDLAQVAQYLAYRQDRSYPRQQLAAALKDYLMQRHAPWLAEELAGTQAAELKLDSIISSIGKRTRAARPDEAHARLARLPFPIYVTANRDNLLFDALEEAGKKPRYKLVRWRPMKNVPKAYFEWEADYEPDHLAPVILHLFGNLEYPESLVVSEDDYFDFLLGVARSQAQQMPVIPTYICSQLAGSGLLFLGFELDDWDFRILFRSILMQEGNALGEKRVRVAVQLNPDEERITDSLGARKYLERYFQIGATYGIFWGDPDEFMDELFARWKGNP